MLTVANPTPQGEPIVEEGVVSSASVTCQPTNHQQESPASTLPTSQSDDHFLTTPDGEDGDKDISAATGEEGEGLKHRNPAPKKDLLEIDRFTICGNRID
ncbi:transmembrane anterior posterior transformation protein 1 homolog [Oncorhynchus tshawytscha]|nr:transmembrane anterior posterior transformation protein 1 homolog [Oncorhynchus tshawytscha]